MGKMYFDLFVNFKVSLVKNVFQVQNVCLCNIIVANIHDHLMFRTYKICIFSKEEVEKVTLSTLSLKFLLFGRLINIFLLSNLYPNIVSKCSVNL